MQITQFQVKQIKFNLFDVRVADLCNKNSHQTRLEGYPQTKCARIENIMEKKYTKEESQ